MNRERYLELQHGFALVGLQHEAERADPGVGVVGLLPVALQGTWHMKHTIPDQPGVCSPALPIRTETRGAPGPRGEQENKD